MLEQKNEEDISMKHHIPEQYKKYLNKRVLTVAGICLLLAAAVVTNVIVNSRTTGTTKSAAASSTAVKDVSTVSASNKGFFASYREERDNVRTQELAYLDAIVAQGADEATISDAQKQKLELINCMEIELTVENLVRGKGFDDVIVSMHAGSVNVIVGAESLTDEQVAQILDIVLRETGESAENVKISTAI